MTDARILIEDGDSVLTVAERPRFVEIDACDSG